MDAKGEDAVRWADVKTGLIAMMVVIGVVAVVCGVWMLVMIPLGTKPYM